MKTIFMVITFIVSVLLVVIGQRTVGYQYLAMQIVGVVGILYVLKLYNERYK